MTYRINGTGTTISPMPNIGQYSIAMYWFTFFFMPIIPLGWRLVKGVGHNKYVVLKRLRYTEVKQAIGTQGMLLTLAYGIVIDLIMCVVFIVVGTLCL